MNRRFVKYLKVVAACHVAVLVAMLTTSGWTGMFRRTAEMVQPVEFVVEVPGEPVKNSRIPVIEPETTHTAEPEKDESRVEDVKTAPVNKKKIERSTKKITRVPGAAGGGGAKKTSLSPEEIRKFLDMGARASDHTSIPGDEETRCLAIVQRTMDEAWVQPSIEDAGNSVAKVKIGLSRDGGVLWRKISQKSGNEVFDDSVIHAVNSVQNIDHLTPGFLEKFREIEITFKLH